MTEPKSLANQKWARSMFAIYGPTLVASIGFGAVIPLVALRARGLGASIGLAAFMTALSGIAQVLSDLPAGVITDRIGEKYAMVGACLLDTITMVMVFFTHSLLILGIATTLQGFTAAIFGLARQTYLAEHIPAHWRARAMSTLGGVFRAGWFIGPLISAAVISRWDLNAAFCFAGAMSLTAALITMSMPALPGEMTGLKGLRERRAADHPSMMGVLKEHRHALLTLGVGCLQLMLVRSVRQTIIPLWAESHGISAASTSLIYSVSMAFDALLFFPGGAIMDHFGRRWVSVPAIGIMSLCLLALPLSHTTFTIALVACLLGLGNGVSSGIVMTLGADLSPDYGRAQFLAGWRVFADTGNAAGPLIVSAVVALISLPFSSVVVGIIGVLGTGWLYKFIPRTVEKPANSEIKK